MNFKQASQMKEGTKFKLKEYSNDDDYLYFHCGIVYNNIHQKQYAHIDLFEAEWEIVVEDKDWNLSDVRNDKDKSLNSYYYSEYNVKKCRDLILEDIKEKVKNRVDFFECFEEIINKRFGDLK